MDNKKTQIRPPLCHSVKKLRLALGDTQQQFANRLKLAISTVVRYELTRPPKGEALVQLMNLAQGEGLYDIAAEFRSELSDALGFAVPVMTSGAPVVSLPGQEEEFRILQWGLQRPDLYPDFQKKWREITSSLRADRSRIITSAAINIGISSEVHRRLKAGESVESIAKVLNRDQEEVQVLAERNREMDLIGEKIAQKLREQAGE